MTTAGRAMKESGIGWAALVPSTWRTARIVSVARLESGHTPSRLREDYWVPSECTIPWFSLGDVWQLRDERTRYVSESTEKISPRGVANSAARLLPPGTVILSRTASVGFSGILRRAMATTQDFANFVCGDSLVPEYLLHALRAMKTDFDRLTMGSTHRTIYMPDIRKLAIPLPPIDEQREIASFLDGKTAAIDALVGRNEGLLALLEEQRLALLTLAVTKGIDATVPMEESGVQWIGRIPRHWIVKALKWETPVLRGASPRPIDDQRYFDEEGHYSWVRISDVTASGGRLLKTEQRLSSLGAGLSVRLVRGSLFMSIAGSVGKTCVTEIDCCIHDGFVYFPMLKRIRPEFLKFILDSGAPYAGLGKLGTQLNLNTDTVGSIRVGVPPIEEQDRIIAFLSGRLNDIGKVQSAIETQIERLREYRQAVITAAVTGQLDVRLAGALEPAA